MGKFLNKNELILVILIILLFEFNGFCGTALNHIMYGKRKHTFVFFISIALLLYQIFVFHTIISHLPIPDVKFKIDKLTNNEITCETQLKTQIDINNDRVSQLKNIEKMCKNMSIDDSLKLTEKIVLNFIAIVLVLLFISTILVSGNFDANGTGKKIFLGIPVIIISLSLFVYTNIYKSA